jgi:TetR/AcrR family transcriptional regulator, mexJK operon transcriptional repressor
MCLVKIEVGWKMATVAREARREDRRDAILDVAYECFVAEGYGSTSMSTIAARLGGSKGTLYNYFKSKEELFEAFVRRACARLQQRMDLASKDGDARDLLVQMACNFLDHLLSAEGIAIHRIVVGEGERFPELARLFYEAGPRTGLAKTAKILEGLMDQGVLRRSDPVLAAYHMKDLALSGLFNLRLWGVIADPTPQERAARAETAVDTFLRAYAP